MANNKYQHIYESEEYKLLTVKRRKLVWPLFIITNLIYYTFVLFVAFAPETLGITLSDTSISIGIWSGLAVIFTTFLITGIYVHFANKMDPLVNSIKNKIESEIR